MGTIHYTRIYARKGSEEKIFASVKEATEFVKGRADRVYKCCQGILQSHRGWRFSYTPFEPVDKDEEWRDIEGYGGRYQVSNKGNVRSLQRGWYLDLKPRNQRGYLFVVLYDGEMHKRRPIHRIVAETFIPNPNDYPIINHKDENPANNCVENLEWCTYKYNSNYGTRNEKVAKNNPRKRAVVLLTSTGEYEREFESTASAARHVGSSAGNVVAVCKHQREKCRGRVFLYKDEWLIKEGYFNKEYLEE